MKVSGDGRTAWDRRAGGPFRPGRRRRRACRVAGRGRSDAELILVNVQNLETLDISNISAVMTVEVDRCLAAPQSRTALHRAMAPVPQGRGEFRDAGRDRPPESIDRVAREVHANQIVMGSRGLGSLGNLLLGCVAVRVVKLSQVPVTLVK